MKSPDAVSWRWAGGSREVEEERMQSVPLAVVVLTARVTPYLAQGTTHCNLGRWQRFA